LEVPVDLQVSVQVLPLLRPQQQVVSPLGRRVLHLLHLMFRLPLLRRHSAAVVLHSAQVLPLLRPLLQASLLVHRVQRLLLVRRLLRRLLLVPRLLRHRHSALVLGHLPSAPAEERRLHQRLVLALLLLLLVALAGEVAMGGVGLEVVEAMRQRQTVVAPPPARWSRPSGRFRRKNESTGLDLNIHRFYLVLCNIAYSKSLITYSKRPFVVRCAFREGSASEMGWVAGG